MEIDFALPSDNSSQLTQVTGGRGRGGAEQEKKKMQLLYILCTCRTLLSMYEMVWKIFL